MTWLPAATRRLAAIPAVLTLAAVLATPLATQDAPTPATARLDQLRQQRDALSSQQRRSLVTGEVDALVDAYLAAAKTYGGDAAVPFLVDALELAPQRRTARDIVTLIARDFGKSSALELLAPTLPTLKTRCGVKPANDLFTKLEQDSPSARVRAWAVLARLETTLRSSKPGSDRYEKAKVELTKAVQGVDDTDLQTQFADLFAREHTTVGATAPDVAGTDLDGVDFKLSDYKGKVVLLDFWGDW